MQVDYIVSKKNSLYQNIYLIKERNYFKMTKYKSASVPINPRVVNLLLLVNRNAEKKTIK